jgi:hypothetical protein
MSNLFLIAHKVRGEPAFDIAAQMECPECGGGDPDEEQGCAECDHHGYWWIIPTSGHRAYPAATWNLKYLYDDPDFQISVVDAPLPVMDSLPDHYIHGHSPHEIKTRIEDLIATLLPNPPTKPFKTRRL